MTLAPLYYDAADDGVRAYYAAIEAKRDFWLAQADLDMALIGKPSLTPSAGPASAAGAGADAGH